jgi:predicted ATPase/DNA-binding SARP family transcriptional activator
MMPWQNQRVQIGMLGPLEVRSDDGAPADVQGARLRGLLVALALRPGQLVPKASLIDWIWAEQPPADAAGALQRLVSRLRRALPDGAIDGQPEGYRLRAAPDAVDAVRFERLVLAAGQARGQDAPRQARLLREALGLWRGAAMQDVGLPDSGAFDAAVVRLEELRLTATEERADAEAALGRGAEMITELTDLAAAHPVRERLVGALMRALVAAGRDTEALLVYQRTRETLADTLGVDPSPGLSALHVALLRGELGQREVTQREETTRKTNLRAELTSFVGKDADVAAVRELIASRRLTTLTGPGGSGKTRLATETARTLPAGLPDGVWLVDLAAIGADGDVAQAALTALGLRDALLGGAPDDPTGRLVTAIREREALLILDNCEHVIELAAVFAHRVLGECPRLRILATSREPLGITGEALWLVEPLAVPAGNASTSEIESAPAVQLLRDRAGAVRRDLAPNTRTDPGTLATMARVCRALDGMPLAIELAAARLRTMSVEQLAGRLDDRFRLLTGGSRTALPRHQTLRAVVDWSWTLLTDPERSVLRRLSVFLGGASLEAAEPVCADGEGVSREQVLDLLTALADKSLLVTEVAGSAGMAPRFRMTGTIREYAGQRLAEAGESELARRAHLAYFTELTETAEPHLRRAQQLEWLAVLEAEHDNIASAMRGALAAGEAPAAMRLAAGAGWYWWLAGHKAEGIELLTAAANTPGEVPDDTRALVYAMIVHFVSARRGDEEQLAEWVHRTYRYSQRSERRHPSLEVVAALERMLRAPGAFLSAFEPLLESADPWVRALARVHVGKARIVLGRSGQDGLDADAHLTRALDEFRALGERFGIWLALTELADRTAVRGDLTGACEYYDQAVAVLIETGAVEDVIPIRSRQAQLYWLLGDAESSAAAMADARRYAERIPWPDALVELALAQAELARWAGDEQEARRQLDIVTTVLGDAAEQPDIRAVTHDLLGYLAADLAAARTHHAAACQAAAEAGYLPMLAKVLVGVADLALRRGQDEQAARLLAASDAVRGLPDRSRPDEARIERTARSRLGDALFAEAARDGMQTSWPDLVTVTLSS